MADCRRQEYHPSTGDVACGPLESSASIINSPRVTDVKNAPSSTTDPAYHAPSATHVPFCLFNSLPTFNPMCAFSLAKPHHFEWADLWTLDFGLLSFSILIKMKKMVVKLPIEDEKAKRKALKLVAGVEGVESVAADVKENKMTVVGDADPVHLTAKLRKLGYTELVSVGPAKEDEKPQAEKKEEKDEKPQVMYVSYDYPPLPHHYYSVPSEESPSGCTIL